MGYKPHSFLAVNHGIKDSNDFNSKIPLDFFFPLSMPALNNFCFSLITRSLSQIIFLGTTCQ